MRPLIIFDVDMVLGDGNIAPKCRHAPGLRTLAEVLVALGYELEAWSAGGESHARSVVKHAGLEDLIRKCWDKPDYPMEPSLALARLGRRPALQIDDDPRERVGDWPFLWADNWYGVPIL